MVVHTQEGTGTRKSGSEADRFVLVVHDDTIDLHPTRTLGVADDGKKLWRMMTMVAMLAMTIGGSDGVARSMVVSTETVNFRRRAIPIAAIRWVEITFPRQNGCSSSL